MMRQANTQGQLPLRQHLIDPETCIRCNTCESRCPTRAISHERNYVVDPALCTFCMRCVRPCPTGAVDHWFMVEHPYSVQEQLSWSKLPEKSGSGVVQDVPDAFDEEALRLLEQAHPTMGGPDRAPASATKPQVNVSTRTNPAKGVVAGNIRITSEGSASDVHHIIFDFGAVPFPYLEGQSIGVIPPGADGEGRPHAMRLYSIASARDGERPNTNNMALAVKRINQRDHPERDLHGLTSNWLCDLEIGEIVNFVGPFGSTFLMPNDQDADILMICTGTGVSPFRGFTHRRRRTAPLARGRLFLFYGARSVEELPYFGPLQGYVQSELHRELVYSRGEGSEGEYVQDRLRQRADEIAELLRKEKTHIYVCGLKGLEDGVEAALTDIGREHGIAWPALRTQLCREGRLHVETY
jgi:benzoyl-CoA 2,3-dioxygenase component A